MNALFSWQMAVTIFELLLGGGIIFWTLVASSLEEKPATRRRIRVGFILFVFLFLLLRVLLHHLPPDYFFWLPLDDSGDGVSINSLCALMLAAGLTAAAMSVHRGWRRRK